jgi:hypothetical protein
MIRRLIVLLVLSPLAAACASSGAVPRPFPTPAGATLPRSEAPTAETPSLGYAISSTALSLQGSPYRPGGADSSGFDCSGLVRYVFAQHGVVLPRSAGEQYLAGRAVDFRDLAPGDLVFFSTAPPEATHVGIAIGGDEFVHAPNTRGAVRVERLSAAYWSKRLIGVRRVL